MNIPQELFYLKSHEWVRFVSEDTCQVGISDFAQAAMGDIVWACLVERAARPTDLNDLQAFTRRASGSKPTA